MQSQLASCIRYGKIWDQSSRQVVRILYNSTSTLRLLVGAQLRALWQAKPSTSNGYRSAFLSNWVILPSYTSLKQDCICCCLVGKFLHRDSPKNRLSRVPFEPMKEASLRHLTFRTTCQRVEQIYVRYTEIYSRVVLSPAVSSNS